MNLQSKEITAPKAEIVDYLIQPPRDINNDGAVISLFITSPLSFPCFYFERQRYFVWILVEA